MRKERLANVLDKAVTTVLIISVCAAVGYGKWVTTNHTTDLKHQVTELELRLQEQSTQQTEIEQGLQGLQVQLDSANAQNTELSAQIEELKLKKSKPVTIASASRGGATQALTGFEVTWYNDSGTTRSGHHTQDGLTVSVDPRVIPLGSWLRITMPDGTELVRRADDTGGAVKGRILDVYASASTSELNRRGRTHNVTVEILDGEPDGQ